MNFFENITFRKTRTRSMTEVSLEENSANSSKIDGSTSSFPNISACENTSLVQELQQRIDDLTSKLDSAHQEVDNLSLENTELKKTVNELTSKYDVLKKATSRLSIGMGSPRKNLPTSTPRSNSQKQKRQNSGLFTPVQLKSNTSSITITPNQTTQSREKEITKPEAIRNKLCIVSANKTNNILSIAEEKFQNYQICHYVSPNCGIIQLVSNLHEKVHDYSMKDYCVILIGEEDFQKTGNYVEIIIELRMALQSILNTNVILCLPTFKLSNFSTMFNWRIETFNNLLHLDLQTYDYVTVLDSNLDLSYDFTMFSNYSRKLNNQGMRNIFHNLMVLVSTNVITQSQPELIVNDDNPHPSIPRADFFR